MNWKNLFTLLMLCLLFVGGIFVIFEIDNVSPVMKIVAFVAMVACIDGIRATLRGTTRDDSLQEWPFGQPKDQ